MEKSQKCYKGINKRKKNLAETLCFHYNLSISIVATHSGNWQEQLPLSTTELFDWLLAGPKTNKSEFNSNWSELDDDTPTLLQ